MRGRILMYDAAVLILAVGGARADLPDNLGFEAGDLTSWNTVIPGGASVDVLDRHIDFMGPWAGTTEWYPTEGSYFARLKTDGAGSHTQLYQSFTASSGETLAFNYYWKSNDAKPYNDAAAGSLLSGAGTSGSLVSTLFSHSVNTDPSDYWGTPWMPVSHTFTTAGDYTLLIEIWNQGDGASDSYVGIDAVPVPGAVLLGMIGLSVAGIKLRKYA